MQMPQLSRSQQKLRGKKISDMTDDELVLWIDVCELMEKAGLPMKARRSWKYGKLSAEAEQMKRKERKA